MNKKICLSGGITGCAGAKAYFCAAENTVKLRFPLASVFNPAELPGLPSWESYMIICRNRLRNWADTVVFIDNGNLVRSRGVAEEYAIAKKRGLEMFYIRDGEIKKFDDECTLSAMRQTDCVADLQERKSENG